MTKAMDLAFLRVLRVFSVSSVFTALAAGAAAPADCPKQLAEKPQVDPATGKETPAGRAARLELEMVANVLVLYQGCSDVPDFVAAYAPAYREWRAKYRDAIARYEGNAHARRYVQCGLEHERRRAGADTAAGKADKKQACITMGSNIQHLTREGIK